MEQFTSVEKWMNDLRNDNDVENRIVNYLQGLGLEYKTEPNKKQEKYYSKKFEFNMSLNGITKNRGGFP